MITSPSACTLAKLPSSRSSSSRSSRTRTRTPTSLCTASNWEAFGYRIPGPRHESAVCRHNHPLLSLALTRLLPRTTNKPCRLTTHLQSPTVPLTTEPTLSSHLRQHAAASALETKPTTKQNETCSPPPRATKMPAKGSNKSEKVGGGGGHKLDQPRAAVRAASEGPYICDCRLWYVSSLLFRCLRFKCFHCHPSSSVLVPTGSDYPVV